MKIKTDSNIISIFLNNHRILKGYILAFIATLGMSNVYIFSKAALKEIHLIQFGFYWFGFAMIWTLSYLIISGKIKSAGNLNKKSKILLIIIGIFELLAAVTLFIAISIVENPAVVSFLSNLTPIFVTIFGIYVLRERFNVIEAIGILITLTGAIIISYTGQTSLKEMFAGGTGWILLSSLFLSISIIIAKSRITKIDPSILTLNRIAYLFFFSLALMMAKGKSISISDTAMFNIFIGSVIGPFLTGLAQYSALKYIEASRTMIIQATRGLFVMIGAIIYLSILPQKMQIIGGIVTIMGVIIIATGKIKWPQNQRKKQS
jgi:drug/metabolite transporter (DMT)-like permease